MKVIGLLSWYEEDPEWLVECVASAARLCDHLIAVDGPYAEFPGALRRPASSTEQSRAILSAAAGAGIGCTVHASRQAWWGNEIEKRDFMFRLGATFATPHTDWFLRIDADEILSHVPPDTRELLRQSPNDVAEVTIWERDGAQSPFRCLFRALPGIGIQQAHYVVTAPTEDGRTRVLCGNASVHQVEAAEPLWDVRLEHRTQSRDKARKQAKRDYYQQIPELERIARVD